MRIAPVLSACNGVGAVWANPRAKRSPRSHKISEQAEDGIRDHSRWLEFRRVLFRSNAPNILKSTATLFVMNISVMSFGYLMSLQNFSLPISSLRAFLGHAINFLSTNCCFMTPQHQFEGGGVNPGWLLAGFVNIIGWLCLSTWWMALSTLLAGFICQHCWLAL